MWDFAPAWLKGLFQICSHIGLLVWNIITALWAPIAIIVSVIVALYEKIADAWEWVSVHVSAAVAVLSDATDAFETAKSAGWPSQLASAVHWANQWIPLTEMCIALVSLTVMTVIVNTVRMVKSIIPTIAS